MTTSHAGLVITAAVALNGTFQWGVRQSVEVENQMTSVERVMEYGQLPSEAALESSKGCHYIVNPAIQSLAIKNDLQILTTSDNKPPGNWPSEGCIRFDDMSLSYAKNVKVLRNITCLINAREKVFCNLKVKDHVQI